MIAITAAIWFDDIKIGLVIAAAIVINLFIAAFSGVAMTVLIWLIETLKIRIRAHLWTEKHSFGRGYSYPSKYQ